MESAELNKICRTCLSDNIDLQSLFHDTINEMIMACSQVQIVAGDGLPETICAQCINQLNEAYKFKQQCENADSQLRNILETKPVNNDLEIKFELVANGVDSDNNLDNMKIDDTKIIAVQVIKNENEIAKDSDESQNDAFCVIYNAIQKKSTRGRPKGSVTIKKNKRVVNNSESGKNNPKRAKTIQSSSKCNLCTQTLVNSTQSTHEINCHQPGKHACLSCKKLFGEVRFLKQHLRVHRLERNYVCETCNKAFYGANDLMIHMRIHTGEKPLNCTVCSKAFSDPRGLNSHMKTHTGEKPYECLICNKRFAHSFVLSTHMRTHTAERPYVCSVCGKTFIYAHNLAIHTRSHSGERPYSCTECDKTFSSSSTLNAHMMTHTGEKRFVCSVCGKKVARSGDLAIHMRSHTGEKPYGCTICSKRYRMSCHLTTHMRTHTGEKNFVCDVCGKAFGDARVLKSHMTRHTGERPHTCETCKKTFAHYSALCTHRKMHLKKKTPSNTNMETSTEQNRTMGSLLHKTQRNL